MAWSVSSRLRVLLRSGLLMLLFLMRAPLASAQDRQPDASFSAPAEISRTAVITYTHDFPQGQPQYVSITLDAQGTLSYESRGPVGRQLEGITTAAAPEAYRNRFTSSADLRDKIFELARQTNYFSGDFDFTRHAIANTGKKSLVYRDDKHGFQTSYVWSEDQRIQELSDIFQNISNTMEAARRLEYYRRFDRLGLEAELKNMEIMAKGHNLLELHAIAAVLDQIASDARVLKLARQRARRLLAKAQAGKP